MDNWYRDAHLVFNCSALVLKYCKQVKTSGLVDYYEEPNVVVLPTKATGLDHRPYNWS